MFKPFLSLWVLVATFALTACGTVGPLYLPPHEHVDNAHHQQVSR